MTIKIPESVNNLREGLLDCLANHLGKYEYRPDGKGTTIRQLIPAIRVEPPRQDKELFKVQLLDSALTAARNIGDTEITTTPVNTIIDAGSYIWFPRQGSRRLIVTSEVAVGATTIEASPVTPEEDLELVANQPVKVSGLECVIGASPEYRPTAPYQETYIWQIKLIQWEHTLSTIPAQVLIQHAFDNPTFQMIPYADTSMGEVPEQVFIGIQDAVGQVMTV